MKEFKTVLREYQKIDFGKHKAALATVVKVRGSSYRSPGARMLITDDGRWLGSISGGCLEGDALRKARQVMQTKTPMTVVYDTREESNQNLGIGLGCNGVIHVLIEPLDPADNASSISIFTDVVSANKPVVMGTIFDSDDTSLIRQRILVDRGGKVIHSSIPDTSLAELVISDLMHLFERNASSTKSYSSSIGTSEVYLELIPPCISVIIFGGGFDARPVSALAKSMGWEVSVTDECVAHIAPLFFPTADKLSLCDRTFIERDFNITSHTACILMSHNYEYDRDVLKKILKSPTPYIGILGPRKRFDKMIEEFSQEGITITSEETHKIHSPIGIDIGAEAPDEIAVSIVAEIQAKFSNRSGGFLKYRQGPIHQRDNTGQVFKQIFLQEKAASKSAQN